MTFAEKALNWINNQISEGRTVYISTALRAVKVDAKTVRIWEEAGRPLFRLDGDGLRVGSGDGYNLIATSTMSLCRISAR